MYLMNTHQHTVSNEIVIFCLMNDKNLTTLHKVKFLLYFGVNLFEKKVMEKSLSIEHLANKRNKKKMHQFLKFIVFPEDDKLIITNCIYTNITETTRPNIACM